MTNKRTLKEGPEQFEPDAEIHLRPDFLTDAVPGNRYAVAGAYQVAGMLLKARRPLPDSMQQWLGERLEALGQYLATKEIDKNLTGTNRALGIVGKPGGNATPLRDEAADKQLAWEVYYMGQSRPDLTVNEICQEVAARRVGDVAALHRAVPSRVIDLSTFDGAKVKAAWARRAELDPSIPPLPRRARRSRK